MTEPFRATAGRGNGLGDGLGTGLGTGRVSCRGRVVVLLYIVMTWVLCWAGSARAADADLACPPVQPMPSVADVMARLQLPADTTGVMLWRFEGERGQGHVFGTVHLGPPFVHRGPPQAMLALRNSDMFAGEILMDEAAQQRFLARAQIGEGAADVLSEASLGSSAFGRYLQLAQQRGIAVQHAQRLKAWAAFLTIGRPVIPPHSSLDEMMERAGARMQRKTVGLQQVEELLDVLDAIPQADQVAILKDTICQQRSLGRYYHELLKVYSTGVPEAVALFNGAGREDDPVYQRLVAKTVTERNPIFVERVLELVGEGSVFVTIGAQHLVGPDGILERLKRAGFSVQALR